MRYSLGIFAILLVTATQSLAQAEDIRIGVIFGFTGEARAWAENNKQGLELAQEEINSAGGINGRKLSFIFEDSKTSPAGSVTAYKKLTAVDKVNVIIGDVWAFLTNPMVPLADKDKVILISPTLMPESAEVSSPYFFTMGHKIAGLTEATRKFYKQEPITRKMAILSLDDPWNNAIVSMWKRVANEFKISSFEITHNDFGHDFKSDVTKVGAQNPDSIVVTYHADDVGRRLLEQNLRYKILSSSDVVEAMLIRKAPVERLKGIYFMDWPVEPAWKNKFRKKFGKMPIMEAQNSYEIVRSLVKAYTLNSPDLLSALKKVKYTGIEGKIDFTKDNFPNQADGQLFQVADDGSFSLVN